MLNSNFIAFDLQIDDNVLSKNLKTSHSIKDFKFDISSTYTPETVKIHSSTFTVTTTKITIVQIDWHKKFQNSLFTIK